MTVSGTLLPGLPAYVVPQLCTCVLSHHCSHRYNGLTGPDSPPCPTPLSRPGVGVLLAFLVALDLIQLLVYHGLRNYCQQVCSKVKTMPGGIFWKHEDFSPLARETNKRSSHFLWRIFNIQQISQGWGWQFCSCWWLRISGHPAQPHQKGNKEKKKKKGS